MYMKNTYSFNCIKGSLPTPSDMNVQFLDKIVEKKAQLTKIDVFFIAKVVIIFCSKAVNNILNFFFTSVFERPRLPEKYLHFQT